LARKRAKGLARKRAKGLARKRAKGLARKRAKGLARFRRVVGAPPYLIQLTQLTHQHQQQQ